MGKKTTIINGLKRSAHDVIDCYGHPWRKVVTVHVAVPKQVDDPVEWVYESFKYFLKNVSIDGDVRDVVVIGDFPDRVAIFDLVW